MSSFPSAGGMSKPGVLALFLLVSPSVALAQKSSYFRYDNVEAYLLRNGSGWQVKDFAAIALNPNRDRSVKVVFRVSANDPGFLFCPRGPDSCEPGPLSTRFILEKFNDRAKDITGGINTPGFIFPPAGLAMEYRFKGTVEVYSCSDLNPYTGCDPPESVSERELRPPFYSQNVHAFTSPEGYDPRPENALRDSWQRFDQFMDVYWDKDLGRVLVPFANLYRHLSDWPYGWQTSVTVENVSNRDVDMKLVNHLWYGTHGHAARCEPHNERTLTQTFRVAANSRRTIDPYRDVSARENGQSSHRLAVGQLDEVPWEHDSSLSIDVCAGSVDANCFETLQRDLKFKVRVFPNELNKRLCVKPPDLIQQLSQLHLKREATEAEINFWLAEIYDHGKTATEIASTFARRGSLYSVRRTGQPSKRGQVRALAEASGIPFSLRAIATQGEPAPGTGGGVFANFSLRPDLNDIGEIAFAATINRGTSSSGIFLFSQGNISPVVLAGQALGNFARFTSFYDLAINDKGDVAFLAIVAESFIIRNGVFLFSRGEITTIVLSEQKLSDDSIASRFNRLDLSNSGSIAFSADGKIYLYSRGSIATIAAPRPNTFTIAYDRPSMNDAQIAFVNQSAGFRGSLADTGVSIHSGGVVTTIFSGASPSTPDVNDSGSVVFQGCQATCGLYRFDGNQTTLLSPSNGKVLSAPQINNRGQIAYAEGASYDSRGMLSTLVLYDNGTFTQIANPESPAPGGSRFTGFQAPSLNNAGALAFIASTVTSESIVNKAIIFASPMRPRRRP